MVTAHDLRKPTMDELTAEEQALASSTDVWVVWSYDTFGFGDDRDPPTVESIHLERQAAEAELRRREDAESKNMFLKFMLYRSTLADILGRPGAYAKKVRPVLETLKARQGSG